MKRLIRRLTLLIGGLLALCGCSGLDLLDVLTSPSGYKLYADIPYGSHERQKLDIYVPAGAVVPGRPVLLFFYGGSWQTGSKDKYRFIGQAFASQGYTTVIADYRLYPEIRFPDFMYDCAAALVWTHDHIGDYGGNARHLFVAGHSAGGYNAVMLATNPIYLRQRGGSLSWISGVIGYAGPYDFLPLTDPALIAIFGGDTNPETQPIYYVTAGLPPMLLVTGDADTEVLPRNSINMAAKLKSLRDWVDQKTYPGIDHTSLVLSLAGGFHDRSPAFADTRNFIMTHMSQKAE